MTQVFILAGQSNMEGQAVVDLTGRDYNDGRGTLATLIKEPRLTRQMRHLQNPDGSWRTRNDVRVWYKPEGSSAPGVGRACTATSVRRARVG